MKNYKFYIIPVFVSIFFINGCNTGNIKNELSKNIASSLSRNIASSLSTAPEQPKIRVSQKKSSNKILESAGYTKPNSIATSTTISECVERMPSSVMNLVAVCMNKIEAQKKGYLSPYEASRLQKIQKMERDNMQKKK